MNRLGIAAFAVGALIAASLATLGVPGARAQEPTAPVETGVTSLRCRVFHVDSESGATWETTDRTVEVGQWVGEQEDGGWRLHDVDFEMGQKATGYPQGYVQVCVRPA